MYYNDHLPPHFHVRYNQQKAIVSINTLDILAGKLTSRVTKLVTEWAIMHQTELLENWELALNNQPLKKIIPLE